MFGKLQSGLIATALFVFLALHLYLGTRNTAGSAYTTAAGVYGEYMNGVIRLVFPFVVTLLAALPLNQQLTENYIQQTRGRVSLQGYLLKQIKTGVAANMIFFTIFGLATTAAASFVAPALNPKILLPSAFGLTEAQALDQVQQQNPLGFALSWGSVGFGLASTVWMAFSSACVSLVAIACVLLTRRRTAILMPLGLYIFESLVTQVLRVPALSFLLVMPTPSSMGSLSLFIAALPCVCIATFASLAIWFVIRFAPKYGWFA